MNGQTPLPGTSNPNSIESHLNRNLFSQYSDKSFMDKLFAKEEVNEVKDLIQKPILDREDLLKVLYLMAGNEIKLVNFGDKDRYLLGKYFAWIRDFVACAELLFDYKDDIKKGQIKLLPKSEKLLEDEEKMLLHSTKFLVDIFFYISRSTLSLGAVAFDTASKQRFEYAYPQQETGLSQPEKRSFFGIKY